MKPKVFIAKPIPKEVEEYIAQYCEYKIWNKEESIPIERLLKEAADIDGLMTSQGAINMEFLKNTPRLKIVSKIGVGYDNLDTDAMKACGVLGTHTPYVLDETVADLVFGLILSAARRIPELHNFVKDQKWDKSISESFLYGQDVHHATIGIIGMGRIGEKIARRAALGFEMKVLYNSTTRKPALEEKYGIHYSEINPLLEESDFVLMMLPLNESTYHFMGEEQFNRMKSSAIFINCARGQVVDEKALIHALKEGKIYGAGLDVYEAEPVEKDNPLLEMANVVTLPHIGSATEKTRFDMAMIAAKNLVAGVTGQVPEHVVPELQDLIK
ncbi:D-isomer specific 2-hydroxyacid dehydrogenase NAD-binding protein [Neobacillus bataviensis LMG 21833]|uniref:Glyoxylate/hydroxypyruvate reductase B n=1 Tax=Neobacillus bataviensis LMG 21833 TaxID=1117379 RepID=K6D981_9BACI|nr:D-glycerate dehydrogenase [Neobacillus bataviensis]EKN69067.1 D-isomer specific 2-hydroxyacid dehydrogenase NAD-binding protein [Neobacillus bataviensis LMG 21833]